MNAHACDVNANLTHTCRLMLGARAAGYPNVPDNFDAQHLAHEQRAGARLDFAHAFAHSRQLPFDDRHVKRWASSRRQSYVIHNWKPVDRWADVESPAARERINFAARRIATLPKQVMIVLHHEPENDLARRGVRNLGAGTAADYRRMWRIVREIFDEAAVANVVWGMAYMNYPKWDQIVPELWPGDDLVDWLWCNAYGSPGRPHPGENIAHFADLADKHQIAQNLPWGIIEWSAKHMSRAASVDYFNDAAVFLDTSAADRLRAWVVFDSPGAENDPGLRLGFDELGKPHSEKLAAYKTFANHPKFSCQSHTL